MFVSAPHKARNKNKQWVSTSSKHPSCLQLDGTPSTADICVMCFVLPLLLTWVLFFMENSPLLKPEPFKLPVCAALVQQRRASVFVFCILTELISESSIIFHSLCDYYRQRVLWVTSNVLDITT